jgi:prepilin-type N-terminal cleavage/methylation domain-containing protein
LLSPIGTTSAIILGAVPPTSQHFRKRSGLTLVEMLTVLFIVSILVAFVTGLARHAARAAETRRARADLHLLADALERYYLRFGDYPLENGEWHEATNLLVEVVETLPGNGDLYEFRRSLPDSFSGIDPWGSSYFYYRQQPEHGAVSESPEAAETFRLLSRGPDREEATDDDIVL